MANRGRDVIIACAAPTATVGRISPFPSAVTTLATLAGHECTRQPGAAGHALKT